jgi:hypothetical protein
VSDPYNLLLPVYSVLIGWFLHLLCGEQKTKRRRNNPKIDEEPSGVGKQIVDDWGVYAVQVNVVYTIDQRELCFQL